MTRLLILLGCVTLFASSQAQKSPYQSWSYSVFVGGSNMLGDLGGNQIRLNFPLEDLDIRATRPAIGIGGARHWKYGSVGLNVNATWLAGSDAYTDVRGRTIRNLSVRTSLIEANLIGELRPFVHSRSLNKLYFFGGIGGFFYQPKARYNNQMVKLRPLGTEGQSPYSKYALSIPFGFGYKIPIRPSATINLEFGFRKTFTDYLDDVSTVYALPVVQSEAAIALADRSVNGLPIGNKRGNPNNQDSYLLVGLRYQKTIGGKKSSCFYDEAPASSRRRIKRHQRGMFN